MPALSITLLSPFARLLRGEDAQRRAARVLRRLVRTHLPVIAAERFAARHPDAAAHGGPAVSPILRRLAPGDPIDGPLEGGAVVIKDSIDLAGERTGLGRSEGGAIAEEDAVIVARVRAAGGVLVGKTKMTELGMDGLGALMSTPMPGNPRAPGYFPGGSSTGTAVAVASGLARFGLGGDGLGSVRIPAAFCGLVGLKPTWGRLPAEGYRSPSPSVDVPGPIAASVKDCALLWQVMAGEVPAPLTARVPARIGVIAQLGPELATRAIAASFRRMLKRLRSMTVVVDVPGAEHNLLLGAVTAMRELAASTHAQGALSPAGQLTVALGSALGVDDGASLDRRRDRLREATLRALDRAEVLAMPTTAIPAPAITRALLGGAQDAILLRAVGAFTPLANCTGLPAIAVPSGVDERGRPLSIMFVGRPGSEAELLALALAAEETGLGRAPIGPGDRAATRPFSP